MEIKEVLLNIDGMNERFATLILRYIDIYINMSSNKVVIANNIVQQIKRNVTGIRFKNLDGVSGAVSNLGTVITLDDTLDERKLDNTFLHEFTHLISKNEYMDGNDLIQPNCGFKVGQDDRMDFNGGFRLTQWEIDGNNYAYNKGIETFDEWVTEWLANKMSDFQNVEVKEDTNGFFRKKTSHGYDGSNVMNLLELVYGSENVANLITGFDLTEEERKSVIPIKEIHKLNQMIDSESILTDEEKEIFKNLQPPYMKIPNITGLITYYISEYQKQNNLQDYNGYLQKMLNVLVRTYSVSFSNKISECNSVDDLRNIYDELSVIQSSMIWTEDLDKLKSLETFQMFEKMKQDFSSRITMLNANVEEFSSLYLAPSQLLEKFRSEEIEVQKLSATNIETTQKK